jgi:hypothetical protein
MMPYYWKGLGAYKEKKYQEAAQYLETALKINDSDTNPKYYAGANALLGLIYENYLDAPGHLETSMAYFRKALKIDPGNTLANEHLAPLKAKIEKSKTQPQGSPVPAAAPAVPASPQPVIPVTQAVQPPMPVAPASPVTQAAQPAAAVTTATAQPTPDKGAVFTSVTGKVWIQGLDAQAPKPAQKDSTTVESDRVRTEADGNATLLFFDGSELSLGPNTDLLLEKVLKNGAQDKIIRLKMFLGTVWANVLKLFSSQSTFEIESGGVVCGVRGTKFDMTNTTGKDTLRLRVSEGTVYATANGSTADYAAGADVLFKLAAPVAPAAGAAALGSHPSLGLGAGWSYVGVKYHFDPQFSSELRFAYGDNVYVYSGRGYWNFQKMGKVDLFTGLEAGYITFDTPEGVGTGYEVSPFIGGEYFFMDRLSFVIDFSAAYIHLISTDSITEDSLEWVANGALYLYPF